MYNLITRALLYLFLLLLNIRSEFCKYQLCLPNSLKFHSHHALTVLLKDIRLYICTNAHPYIRIKHAHCRRLTHEFPEL